MTRTTTAAHRASAEEIRAQLGLDQASDACLMQAIASLRAPLSEAVRAFRWASEEEEVISLRFYVDGSATPGPGWPRCTAYAGWAVVWFAVLENDSCAILGATAMSLPEDQAINDPRLKIGVEKISAPSAELVALLWAAALLLNAPETSSCEWGDCSYATGVALKKVWANRRHGLAGCVRRAWGSLARTEAHVAVLDPCALRKRGERASRRNGESGEHGQGMCSSPERMAAIMEGCNAHPRRKAPVFSIDAAQFWQSAELAQEPLSENTHPRAEVKGHAATIFATLNSETMAPADEGGNGTGTPRQLDQVWIPCTDHPRKRRAVPTGAMKLAPLPELNADPHRTRAAFPLLYAAHNSSIILPQI